MQVNLFISGRKLKDLDAFSKSDPACLVFENRNGQWIKVGQTEQIKNSLNPDFQTAFALPYFFERHQELKFVMIDGDGDGDYDTIGELSTTMGKIMGARAQMFTADLVHNGASNRGQIIVRSEAIAQSNEAIRMDIRLQNVNNVTRGCMGMCDEQHSYYLEVQRNVPNTDNFVTCFRQPQMLREQNQHLGVVSLLLTQICNTNKDARIRFALMRHGGVPFNYFESSVNQILGGQGTLNGHAGASLVFNHAELFIQPSFVDYLRSGWQISLVAAIDFTGSNGHPSHPNSLHYCAPGKMNQYEAALMNVGMIVEPYDLDKSFPVFGFGGVPRFMGIV